MHLDRCSFVEDFFFPHKFDSSTQGATLPMEKRGKKTQHSQFDTYSVPPEGLCWFGAEEHRYFFHSSEEEENSNLLKQMFHLRYLKQTRLAITTILQASGDGLLLMSPLDVAPTAFKE